MSRVVSIEQSEPGFYVINVQRSHFESIGKMLESIGRPPVEDDPAPVLNGTHRADGDGAHGTLAGSSLIEKKRRKGGR